LLGILFLAAVSVPLARAQEDTPETPPYLLRMERIRSDDDVCVLVRSDGRYHLERSNWNKADIFEGTISDENLHRLEHWVGENELFDLQQDQIVAPLFTGLKDRLLLSVNRPEHWQNLVFPAASTWKRYSQSVVPLAQWLDELKKAKHQSKLSEEQGRNSCMPPHRPELTTRAAQAKRQMLAPFVFITQTASFRGKEGTESCAVVYPNGRYHREIKSQRMGSDEVATAVYEGSVKTASLKELKNIMAAPEIENRKQSHLPWGIGQFENEITTLIVPRHGKAQTTVFWQELSGTGGGSDGNADPGGTKALEPLRQWLKSNLEDAPGAPLPGAPLSSCIPPREP
jgi:hypothetical protein